jgi:hypothetical protein
MHEQMPVQMPQPSLRAAIQERVQSMPSYSLRTPGDEDSGRTGAARNSGVTALLRRKVNDRSMG